MKLSIVTTLYRSAETVAEFHRRAMAAAEALTDDIELILVNDGSPDDSLILALAIQKTDPRVVVVDLSRNFGHHKALMTGLMYARGDLAFLIDSDLEEEPELLGRFYERLQVGDCDVVYGVQQKRRGSMFKRVTGALYFSLLKSLSDDIIPRNLMSARLMTKEYVRALARHRDREFVISQLWSQSGFRQVGLSAQKLSRSPSAYSLQKRVEMAIKHITTTSTKLLHIILYLGVGICGFSIAVIVYFFSRYYVAGIGVEGWTSVIVSVWFFGGLITLLIGVLGIYIANILSETKRRPYTVVRQVYRAKEEVVAGSNVVRVPSRGARLET